MLTVIIKIIIITILNSDLAHVHVSTNKVLKALSIHMYKLSER